MANIEKSGESEIIETCGVCLDDMVLSKKDVMELLCGHRFHVKCAKGCVKGEVLKCGMCRAQLRKNYRGVFGYRLDEAGNNLEQALLSIATFVFPPNVNFYVSRRITS